MIYGFILILLIVVSTRKNESPWQSALVFTFVIVGVGFFFNAELDGLIQNFNDTTLMIIAIPTFLVAGVSFTVCNWFQFENAFLYTLAFAAIFALSTVVFLTGISTIGGYDFFV